MTFRASVWTRVLYAALVVVILSQASLALRDQSGLPDSPLTEDGYYSLSVARNIALGNGITIDGQMLTNGFQPLFTFVCVPLFWLTDGDRMLTLRLLLLLHALTLAVAALTFGRIMRYVGRLGGDPHELELRAATAALVYASAAFIFRTHFNGLETGWLLMMYLLCWRMYQCYGVETPTRAAKYGFLLGLLVLTRIDAVFFVIVSAIAELFGKGGLRARATRFIAIGGVAFLASLPWWAYNLVGFGALMPSSGTALAAQGGVDLNSVLAMASALSVVATPSFWVGQHEGIAVLAIRLALFGALLALMPRVMRNAGLTPDSDEVERRTWTFARNLAITYALLTVWYLLRLESTWFYERYLAPAALLGAGALVLVILHGLPRLRPAPLVAIIALSAQIPLFVSFHHMNRVYRGSAFYNDHLQQVLKHVPAGDVVASSQSGTLGYFRDGVINSDGKVNSEVLLYRSNFISYLEKRNIDWWADEGFFSDVEPQSIGWQKVSSEGNWHLYRRNAR